MPGNGDIIMIISAQLIGAIAMALLFVTYQINNRKTILTFQIIIAVCWSVHYSLLGAASGIVINLICILRNILFYNRNSGSWTDNTIIPVSICASEVLLTLLVWREPVDILAMIGASLQTTALWMKTPRLIRIVMISASPLWLIYDYFNGSYVGIATEILVMISIVIAICKYDVPNMRKSG
jgi:hypothetical protein